MARSFLSTFKARQRPTEKQRKGRGGSQSRGNAPLRFLRLLASLPDGGIGPSSSLSSAPGRAGPARSKGLEKEIKISLMDELARKRARAQEGPPGSSPQASSSERVRTNVVLAVGLSVCWALRCRGRRMSWRDHVK